MKSLKKGILATLVAAIGVMSAQSAMAATASATFQVTATVNSACIVSTENVAFGTVTPAATGMLPATGKITSTCTKTTPYTLAISAGTSGEIANRTMAGATSGNADKLAYNLYTSNTYATVWGETVGSNTVGLTGTGTAQTSTIFGRLSLNQYLKPDTYTDNLTVTLAY